MNDVRVDGSPSGPVQHRRVRRAVTLDDVAKAAGVSMSTASRVLHGSGGVTVRAEKQDAVRSAAQRLGYTSNRLAQLMATGRSNVLGIVLSDLAESRGEYAGVRAFARARGLGVISAWTAGESPAEHIRLMFDQGVQGLVVACQQDVASDGDAVAELVRFRDAGRGVCVLGEPVSGFRGVQGGEASAAVRIASMLFGHGYRHPVVLGGGPDGSAAARRARAGFVDTWREFGAEIDSKAGQDVNAEAAVSGAVQALSSGPAAPDVLFAVEPHLMDGAVAAADAGVGRDGLRVAGIRFADRPGVAGGASVVATAVLDRVAGAGLAAELAFAPADAPVLGSVEPVRVEVGTASGWSRASSQ